MPPLRGHHQLSAISLIEMVRTYRNYETAEQHAIAVSAELSAKLAATRRRSRTLIRIKSLRSTIGNILRVR